MKAVKVLTAVNDEVVLDLENQDFNGAFAIGYGAGGVGTVVAEVSVGKSAAGVDEWSAPIKLFDPSAAVNAQVDNIAAAGVVYGEVVCASKLRVRKTIAGPGDVRITLAARSF